MKLELIILLLFIHFISDWILQPRVMAKQKSEKISVLLTHGAVLYFSMFVVFCYQGFSLSWIWVSAIYVVAHLIQDFFLWRVYKLFRTPAVKYWEDYWFYTFIAIDQLIHLSILFYLMSMIVK